MSLGVVQSEDVFQPEEVCLGLSTWFSSFVEKVLHLWKTMQSNKHSWCLFPNWSFSHSCIPLVIHTLPLPTKKTLEWNVKLFSVAQIYIVICKEEGIWFSCFPSPITATPAPQIGGKIWWNPPDGMDWGMLGKGSESKWDPPHFLCSQVFFMHIEEEIWMPYVIMCEPTFCPWWEKPREEPWLPFRPSA